MLFELKMALALADHYIEYKLILNTIFHWLAESNPYMKIDKSIFLNRDIL